MARRRARVLGMIMAGGKGERLHPLTRERSKPSVPFGARYRIIDFVLSNFVNSEMPSLYVLVQYKSQSLIEHLRLSWRTSGMLPDYFVTVVPPQMRFGPAWYRGTADAVLQNLNVVEDFNAEVPDDVARRLRWYRRHILPRLNADVNGDLFVTSKGVRKDQRTVTIQITRLIADLLGIHMTVHQFRHLAGASYLDANPEDTESARALLGHAYSKTTRIYVGSASRRASRAYNRFLFEQREALILKRKRQRTPKTKKG